MIFLQLLEEMISTVDPEQCAEVFISDKPANSSEMVLILINKDCNDLCYTVCISQDVLTGSL